jgi:hypothetical protein
MPILFVLWSEYDRNGYKPLSMTHSDFDPAMYLHSCSDFEVPLSSTMQALSSKQSGY